MSKQAASTTHVLTRDERLEIRRRVANGESHLQVAGAMSRSVRTVFKLLEDVGGLKARERDRSSLRLSLSEREEISRGLMACEPLRMDLAAQLADVTICTKGETRCD